MSHELRTPMNGIMGMTSLALRWQRPAPARPVAQEPCRLATPADVINDILDLSKIEAERLVLDNAGLRAGRPDRGHPSACTRPRQATRGSSLTA
jgi:signal transduction histidine kinase